VVLAADDSGRTCQVLPGYSAVAFPPEDDVLEFSKCKEIDWDIQITDTFRDMPQECDGRGADLAEHRPGVHHYSMLAT
jgi:hypothetical protein